eukprot:TRINITY_DN23049_c0_g1_i1.p1 TRINITY_DN23049_c0_g1~~TRINITY_DN23049_c0_g1_i1.p1  ORF type:complete len:353 (+),score=121.51 TRINITY_DN23049_c0_g1_i1:86-1144(+)
MAEKKGGRKRRYDAAVSVVDEMVRNYGEDWVKWEEYMTSEDGAELAAGSKAELYEHVRSYKKLIDTWPQKETRKAFRSLYRRLKPVGGMSGSLSMMSSAVDANSPLNLPQMEEDAMNPITTGIDDMVDDMINDDEIIAALRTPRKDVLAKDRDAKEKERKAQQSKAEEAAKAKPFAPPAHFVVHQPFAPPTSEVPVLLCQIPQFLHCENDQEPMMCLKRLVDTEVNALVNGAGGHVLVGVDSVVKGYPLTRKQRDMVRLTVDNTMDKWDPRPVLQDLVDVSFVDVRSAMKKVIANHCVVCITALKSAHPVRNTRGDIVRLDKLDRSDMRSPHARAKYPAKHPTAQRKHPRPW